MGMSHNACYAGIEIDAYLSNHNRGFENVTCLLNLIEESLYPFNLEFLEDCDVFGNNYPLAILRTLQSLDSSIKGDLNQDQIKSLIKKSSKYTQGLRKIIQNPQKLNYQKYEELRDFCFTLSKEVRELWRPFEEEEESYYEYLIS